MRGALPIALVLFATTAVAQRNIKHLVKSKINSAGVVVELRLVDAQQLPGARGIGH